MTKHRPAGPAGTSAAEGAGALSVSVVICAYTVDRWDDTLAAVASVRAQSYPAAEILLVVDHNPALLTRLTAVYTAVPGVRVLANAGPRGLSAGRNTGIVASKGEIIAFLDDDAVAERHWLRHFVRAYEDPLVLAVGGRTEPVWASGRRPAWFPEEFDWVVGCMYRGHPPGQVRVRNVLGGNASFRRTAFDAVGGFATGIGRDGDRLPLGCEETELCIRLGQARKDAVLLIDDRAVIHHQVPASRERLGYLRTRAFAEGVSKAHISRLVGAQDGLRTERAYVLRALTSGVARGAADFLRGRPGGAGRAGAIVLGTGAAAAGYAAESLRGSAKVPAALTAAGSGRAPALTAARTGRPSGRPPAADPAAHRPVPVLMYHAVSDTPSRAARALSVTPAAFAGQMALLEARGFTPLTTAELCGAWRAGGALPARPVLVTFDDGYEGVYEHALPVLAGHGFRASLFVSSGWLRGAHHTGGALDRMLGWDQVRALAAAGVEIGGHSHTHPQLDQLADGPLRHEIAYCRELIAAETGTAPVSFAYPYGYSSRRVRQAVREAGFGQSLAVNNAPASRSQSPFALTRLTVRRTTGIEEFARMVEGRSIGRDFARDRVLGKGYAVVRRTRRAAVTVAASARGSGGRPTT